MSGVWREDDDEEYRVGGARGGSRSKPRFSFTEIKLLLEEVKRNRYIILKKFNHGVSAEAKKQTWAEITEQINDLGENRREVRQIMKKWADLKCDGKRRMAAMRGPNGTNLRKKNLGPVEKMVHKILLMSPGTDVDSDFELCEEDDDIAKRLCKGPPPPPFSYLNMDTSSLPLPGGASFDLSPLSSPEKDLSGDPFHSSPDFEFDMPEDGDRTMDFDDEDEDSLFSYRPSLPLPSSSVPLDPLPDDALLRNRPVHTYSRNNNSHGQASSRPPPDPPGPSSSSAAASSVFPSTSDSDPAAAPQTQPPSNINGSPSSHAAPPSSSSSSLALRPTSPLPSSSTPFPANNSTSHPEPSSSSILLPPPPFPAATSSSSIAPPLTSDSSSSFPAPPPHPSSSSTSHRPLPSSSSSLLLLNRPSTSGSTPSDPLPAGASSGRTQDHVAQLASQSLQQQQASRMLLASVSQSLETLAQSVQLLVESQQEFVQESLLLQRETVDVLRDFSNTALAMLRDKSGGGQAAVHMQHASHF